MMSKKSVIMLLLKYQLYQMLSKLIKTRLANQVTKLNHDCVICMILRHISNAYFKMKLFCHSPLLSRVLKGPPMIRKTIKYVETNV